MKHIEGFSALVRLAMVGVDHQNWEDEDLQVAHKFVLGSSPAYWSQDDVPYQSSSKDFSEDPTDWVIGSQDAW